MRQQLSSLLFVKNICEAKVRTLKYGIGELPSLPLVSRLNMENLSKIFVITIVMINFINFKVAQLGY